MSSRRRLDPRRSLTGRLILIIVAVVLATTGAQVIMLQLYRGQVIEENLVRLFIAEVEAANALLAAAAPDDRARVLAALGSRGFEVVERLPPEAAGGDAAPRLARPLERRLRRYAADDLSFAWEQTLDPKVWAGFDIEGRRYWVPFYLSVERGGGQRPVGVWIAVLLGIVAITATSVVALLNRPFRRLGAALREAVPQLRPVVLPATSPSEIGEMASLVNTLTADLRRRQEERELMLAGLSHDLRTPLTRLRLRVDVLDGCPPDDVGALRRDIGAMRDIVDRFVEVVRSGREAGGETADAAAVVGALVEAERDLGRDIVAHLEPFALPIAPGSLERLAANLIDNARRYGVPPLTVELTASAGGRALRVIDQGPGIPPEDRARVIAPFARLSPERAGSGASGLGLFIVDRLAQQSGGRLAFDRTGRGFEASVIWPCEEQELSPAPGFADGVRGDADKLRQRDRVVRS